ncbi:hypothetical protein NQZ68_027007 [Dissostichus eleginoides]|uniref:Endonuclease 4 n=1 Tax=Dissostichus eleginoides TaxID=100907 RepID=A0AAD9EUH0_DISEL|nr:hypothetical protein NQZ68_027007 [Dissostichus eleginoides]KAK1878002.1 putative endonuclease 4 [Dissostichus eleginoides]
MYPKWGTKTTWSSSSRRRAGAALKDGQEDNETVRGAQGDRQEDKGFGRNPCRRRRPDGELQDNVGALNDKVRGGDPRSASSQHRESYDTTREKPVPDQQLDRRGRCWLDHRQDSGIKLQLDEGTMC